MMKKVQRTSKTYLEMGKQDFYARLYAYYSVLIETKDDFRYMRRMLNKGESCKAVAEHLEISPEEAEKMAELLRAEKLVE